MFQGSQKCCLSNFYLSFLLKWKAIKTYKYTNHDATVLFSGKILLQENSLCMKILRIFSDYSHLPLLPHCASSGRTVSFHTALKCMSSLNKLFLFLCFFLSSRAVCLFRTASQLQITGSQTKSVPGYLLSILPEGMRNLCQVKRGKRAV